MPLKSFIYEIYVRQNCIIWKKDYKCYKFSQIILVQRNMISSYLKDLRVDAVGISTQDPPHQMLV